jgi:hypothetical protein
MVSAVDAVGVLSRTGGSRVEHSLRRLALSSRRRLLRHARRHLIPRQGRLCLRYLRVAPLLEIESKR